MTLDSQRRLMLLILLLRLRPSPRPSNYGWMDHKEQAVGQRPVNPPWNACKTMKVCVTFLQYYIQYSGDHGFACLTLRLNV